MSAVRLRGVSYAYPSRRTPVLENIDLDVAAGSLTLVAGASGTGKSTLLRTCNGLVPQHSGGRFTGRVEVAGRDVTGRPPRDVADLVGFVPQDPWAHATADRVGAELEFAMENLGVPAGRMRKRTEEVLDQLGLGDLRERRLDTLSGGERQRVAIAAVLAAHPQVLVLDEPTSNLDPRSAEEVLAVLVRLRDDLGITIVCSEHRLERIAGHADAMVYLPGPGVPPVAGPPRAVMRHLPYGPPVTMLGTALGWEPLPLTVREGRPFAERLTVTPPDRPASAGGEAVLRADGVRFAYNGAGVLRDATLAARRGAVTALLGRNGSGKTTLLRTLVALERPSAGTVTLRGKPLRGARRAAADVAFLPQRAETLLFRDTVRAELEASAGARAGEWLERLDLTGLEDEHPWALSAGQRLRTALGTVLARGTGVVLLDEPTRGMDPLAKRSLAGMLRERAGTGAAVILVTHDVEMVAEAATRVALMAGGEIVAEGPTAEVLGESLLFSSQTSKLMGDARFLVPGDVLAGLR